MTELDATDPIVTPPAAERTTRSLDLAWWGIAALIIALLALVDAVAQVVRDVDPTGNIRTGGWDRFTYSMLQVRAAFIPLLIAAAVSRRSRAFGALAIAIYTIATLVLGWQAQQIVDHF